MGLEFIKDVGVRGAELIVAERERGGPYGDPSDLVRRTGLKPQSIQSLVQAGAFDGLVSNRRQALWNSGLDVRPGRNGQPALPLTTADHAPELPDFTDFERMAGEYRVMGIYPRGHLMQFVRPGPGPASAAHHRLLSTGKRIPRCGWPAGRWPVSIPGASTAPSL